MVKFKNKTKIKIMFKNKTKIFFQIIFTLALLVTSFFSFHILNNDVVDTEEERLSLDVSSINRSDSYFKRFVFKNSISSVAISAKAQNKEFDINKVNFSYRYKYEGEWIDWNVFEMEEDHENLENLFIDSELTFLGDTKYLEISIENKEVFAFDKFEILFFPIDKAINNKALRAEANEGIKIVTRNDWGANEELRFYDKNNPPVDPNKVIKAEQDWLKEFADEIKIVKVQEEDETTKRKYIWPLEYTENVEKIVVHHSAGRTPNCDEELEFLRSIYKFHAKVRGWGDIGYNYIIGPCTGNIYQGRAGSFGVKGAHAGRFNAKTMGVMVMGDYQHQHPSSTSIDSLISLSRFLGEKYGFWPDGYSKMRGINLPNIFGHRDVANTTCPGDMLYARLPEVRMRAVENFQFPKNPHRIYNERIEQLKQRQKESFSAEPFTTGANQIFLEPGESNKIDIMFENIGQRDWNKKTTIKVDGKTIGLKFNGKSGVSEEIAIMKEDFVKKGEIATFEIDVTADEKLIPKNFVIEVIPVINGVFTDGEAKQKFVVIISKNKKEGLELEKIPEYENIFNDHSTSDELITVDVLPVDKIEDEDEVNNEVIETKESFLDVSLDNIYYSYIQDLKNNQIISGNDNYFYPERPITRGEFAKVLVKSTELELVNTSKSFVDIAGTVFEEYIRALQAQKIVKGEQGLFHPNRYVSRAEAITMLVKAFNFEGTTSHVFTDLENNSFKPFILTAASNGIVGKGSIFDPYSLITRDQVAKIISNARKIKNNGILSQEIEVEKIEKVLNKGEIVRVDLNLQEDELEITNDKSYSIYNNNELLIGGIGKAVLTYIKIVDGDKYEIKVNGNVYKKTGAIRIIGEEDGIMELSNVNKFGGKIPYNHYRGDLEIRIDPENNEKLYVINELPLEDYLFGLGEEPQGQPEEKVKAIVVMARSYMEYYRQQGGKFKDRFVHLKSDGVSSQVYLGYDFEINNPIIVDSVKATWGEFLTYDDKVIRAPYFSRSGGHTFTPGTEGNAWNPKAFPFAIRVEDPWSCDKDLEYLEEHGPISCAENQRGHGVGVSAWGIKQMSLDGVKYKDMINYYLTGVEFKKFY